MLSQLAAAAGVVAFAVELEQQLAALRLPSRSGIGSRVNQAVGHGGSAETRKRVTSVRIWGSCRIIMPCRRAKGSISSAPKRGGVERIPVLNEVLRAAEGVVASVEQVPCELRHPHVGRLTGDPGVLHRARLELHDEEDDVNDRLLLPADPTQDKQEQEGERGSESIAGDCRRGQLGSNCAGCFLAVRFDLPGLLSRPSIRTGRDRRL